MKKVLLSLAAIATVCVMASCSKTCDCTVYPSGTTTEVNLDDLKDTYASYGIENDIKKCSDLNIVETAGGVKYGVECK